MIDNRVDSSQDEIESTDIDQIVLTRAYAALKDKAYAYLVRREHSAYELREKLAKADEYDFRDALIEKLIADNLQSDTRFAEHLGRVRTGAGKGPRLLQQELQQHRIEPEIIEQVLETYRDSWHELAERARIKKFGTKPPSSYKEWARQARFLQQRGFSGSHIPRIDEKAV